MRFVTPVWVLTETCADIEGELPECPVCGSDPGPQCQAPDPERPGEMMEVTCVKDFSMLELWDDRCVQVIANTGERVGDEPVAGGH